MKIVPIIGLIVGLIFGLYGGNSLLKANFPPSDLPVELVLIVAFGVFIFLFSLSSMRTSHLK